MSATVVEDQPPVVAEGPPPPPPPVLKPMGLPHFGDDETIPDFLEGLAKYLKKSKSMGKHVGYYTEMGFEWLLVNDAELGTSLLQQNTGHALWPGLIAASSAFFGPKVLFVLEGEEWMKLRRIMRGELLETQVHNFGYDMGGVAQQMMQRLQTMIGKEVDAYTLVTAYHLDAASKALYGDAHVGCVNSFPERSDLVQSYIWFTNELPRRAFAFMEPTLNVDYETDNEDNRIMKKMSGMAHNVILNILKKRLATRDADLKKGGKPDMLELFFQAYDKEYGANATAEQIEHELGANLVELLFAGFNTVSGTMTNAIFRLSQEPEVVAKIRAEVDPLLAGKDRPLNFDDFEKMKYTQLVFQEALRIYGPSPVMARMMGPGDTQLDDLTIPAGTQAMIPLAALAIDPRYWKDPLKMWPERPEWHDDKGNFLRMSRTRGAFMPFSDGPRNCVGQHFAKVEFCMLIGTLFTKFDFSPAHGYEHGASFNGFGFHPCDKNTQERVVRMVVHPRKGSKL
jgi:cytochrome P450|mmetsp:Transcript_11230/g.18449  ORF Transcript_11230/g.18449 Transcript_11230/m.18449 type:complete len:510 (+) Transcript_11230:73-1602(+)